ncbi:uncharacterized protein LOC117340449 [Pecten maximus]|uniref:uncharacterized protein LOC117340449 n=1 Tax=Pecten maximus TaxID=6579 RepID=UPI0014589B6A|nr:uncharacterized protein LOC117340449 [Pecten maximus]
MSNRVCAVTSCKNNGYKLQKWLNHACETHQCLKRDCECPRPFKLIPFPTNKKDPETRLKWAQLIHRKCSDNSANWLPKEDSRVCSDHFVDKVPTRDNPYPTLNLGYTPLKEPKARPPPRRRLFVPTNTFANDQAKLQKLSTDTGPVTVCDVNDDSATPENIANVFRNIPENAPVDVQVDHTYFAPEGESGYTECNECLTKSSIIDVMKKEMEALKEENAKLKAIIHKKSKKSFNVQAVTKSDKKMKFYTGFPTVNAFMIVYTYIVTTFKEIIYWKGPGRVAANPLKPKRVKVRSLKKEELIMTMMKIRLGLLNQDLGDRFGVSATCVSNIISTWLRILGKVIGSLVFNPQKDVVKANLPPSFKSNKFNNVRHIIDCSEVFIEKPSSFQMQAVTWSDYKHHHTLKILISISPSGMINFISNAWGGRASDKFVTENSGVSRYFGGL